MSLCLKAREAPSTSVLSQRTEPLEYDIHSWAEAIANLHANTARNTDNARRAYEATSNMWSGHGYQDAPIEVQRILINAIEIGYMTALNHVRGGDLDNEIRIWRPMLAEQCVRGHNVD